MNYTEFMLTIKTNIYINKYNSKQVRINIIHIIYLNNIFFINIIAFETNNLYLKSKSRPNEQNNLCKI